MYSSSAERWFFSLFLIPDPCSSQPGCMCLRPLITWIRDQLLSYAGASALAIKLAVSWQARIQSYSGWFPAVTTPDPRSRLAPCYLKTRLDRIRDQFWCGSKYFYHRYLSRFLYRSDLRSLDHWWIRDSVSGLTAIRDQFWFMTRRRYKYGLTYHNQKLSH
jgi:hypothetical protein